VEAVTEIEAELIELYDPIVLVDAAMHPFPLTLISLAETMEKSPGIAI